MGDLRDRTAPLVETNNGWLRGRAEDGLAVFRGIPYAAAPVGELRWRPAQPPAGWSGVRDATAYGPSAPQPVSGLVELIGGQGAAPYDEDCLTLNVWTPAVDEARRPVMVWIHGGEFVTGSGSLEYYTGETFARNGDIVAVSINYRIGPFGYLYLGGGDGSANVWLSDQLAALRWVQANIAAFGGDPDNVTLAGSSAGGHSIAAILGRRDARGLFSRAILQSPALGVGAFSPAQALRVTETFAELAGVTEVRKLRELPWPKLLEPIGGLYRSVRRWGAISVPFRPVLDGVTMDREPLRMLLDDAPAEADVLIGWTREEAALYFALSDSLRTVSAERAVDRFRDVFGHRAPAAYAAYAAARPGAPPIAAVTDLATDETFRIPGLGVAEGRAAQGCPPWVYQLDLPSPAFNGRLGAVHGLELPFVFDKRAAWSKAPIARGIDAPAYEGLATVMHQAWISFIRTGDPNHPQLPRWDRYTTVHRSTMRFDTITAPAGDPAGHWRRIWLPD